MALDDNGSLIVTGFSVSTDFPVTDDAFESSHSRIPGLDGAFVIIPDLVPPVADAGEDVFIDQHETIELNASGSYDNGRIVDWTWHLDNGTGPVSLSGISQRYTYHEAGRFIVTLNVSDAVGNWGLDSINVTVRDVTPPIANIDCPNVVDQNELVHIDGTGSTDNVGIVSWVWTIEENGGPLQMSGPTVEHSFAEVGTYGISLNVTDGGGNWATSHSIITVVDTTPPVADAGDDIEIDQHGTVTLDGRGSTDNIGIMNWSWTIPQETGSRTIFGPTIEVTFEDPGLYTIVLVVKDAMDNEGTDIVAVTVLDITPPIAEAGQDVMIDQHEVVVFDADGSVDNIGIARWEWELYYDGITHTSQEPTFEFIFDLVGEYSVLMTVTDAAGNSADDRVNVTVVDTTPPDAIIGPPVYVDQDEEFDLDGGLSQDNVGIVNFTWSLFVIDGPDIVKYGEHVSYSIAVVGDHEIKLLVRDAAGNVDNAIVEVNVKDITRPVAIIEVDKNRTKVGNSVEFDGTASEDNVEIVNWIWTFMYKGNEIVLSNAVSQFRFEKPGEYEVTLTVEDAAGNTQSTSTQVTIDAESEPSSSNWLFIVILLLVVAVVVAVFFLTRKGQA